MHSDLSMQKEFDIKWKSRDISGSASLALWANMNQSTTQLGSKRQSQGKHPYPTINIFICCVVIICPVSIYFYVISFVFSFSVIFARVYILFFYVVFFFNCSFSPRWFSCLQPSCPPSEFVWSLCDAQVYCMSSRGHTLCRSVDIHSMDFFFFQSSSVEAVIK